MMSTRQHAYREAYKANISRFYNGIVHIAVLYGVGIAALWYCLGQMREASWEYLLVVPVFLAGNLFEWYVHRWVMHRRIDVFALRAIYERHTREHHQYFTDNEMTIDSTREFRIVFFPWRVLATFGAAGVIFGSIATLLINANAGYVVVMTMVAQYLIYETFHYCCHVHENWFVRNMPFVNTIRRHHTSHHNLGIMMKYNMNLSFPIGDWLMGTSDLDRGLLGHLFNGYSEKHIKAELEPIIRRFRQADAPVTPDGPLLTREESRVMVA